MTDPLREQVAQAIRKHDRAVMSIADRERQVDAVLGVVLAKAVYELKTLPWLIPGEQTSGTLVSREDVLAVVERLRG